MKKNIKPEDYFSNGIFVVARFGKNVVLHNNMISEMYAKYAVLINMTDIEPE